MTADATPSTNGVDAAGQHFETDGFGLQPSNQFDDMAERSADAVELSNHKSVTGAELIERLGQARPVGDGAATNVFVQTIAAGVVQGIALKRQVLLSRGHAHVADQHDPAPLIQKLSRAGFTRQR